MTQYQLMFLLILTATSLAVAKQVPVAKEYPPYPDVWHYISSSGDPLTSFWRTPTGDVAVARRSYVDRVGGKVIHSSSTVGFFSGQQYPKMSSAEKGVAGFEYLSPTHRGFALADGRVLRSRSTGSARCAGPLSNYLQVADRDGKTLSEYKVLYLPGEQRVVDDSHCDAGGVYSRKVVTLYLRFIPLDDGTFLAFDENIILRLRADLSTESSLFGKRVFFLDRDFDVYEHYRRQGETRTRSLTQDLYYKYLTTLQAQKP
jgi:hypothetical protein